MKKRSLEIILKSNDDFVPLQDAADILGYSCISLIRLVKSDADLGFSIKHTSSGNLIIDKKDFLKSVKSWRWTVSRLYDLSSDYITVEQAADVLGCAERTLRSKFKNNESVGFPYFSLGGKWKIQRMSFIAFMTKGKSEQ